jgi:uncharacterized protein (DUF1778 family)
MANAASSRTARLEARVTPEQKALIERAAAYEGRSVSDFLLQRAQEAARTVIEEHEVVRLSSSQSKAFVEALLRPPAPNDALRQAAKEYHRSVVSQ